MPLSRSVSAGRLDSTNVIPAPLVSVITSIGYDHQALLGDTLAKIAAEKAGIIKRGTLACVTAATDPEPLMVISDVAHAQNVPLHAIGDAENRRGAGNGTSPYAESFNVGTPRVPPPRFAH